MIKLIVTDMDGTFLNSQGSYNKALFDQVKTLMASQGVHFAPCTGKQCERVEEILGDDAHNFLLVADSATRIKHKGEFIYQSLLDNSLGLAIIERLESIAAQHIVIACTEDGAYIKNSAAQHLQEHVQRAYTNVKLVSCYSEIKQDFIKLAVYDSQGHCLHTEPLLADFLEQAYIVASDENWIDIANYGVHKGTTVEKLQNILGVSYEETMVFGDGLNDIELMAKGTFSFAMRNGFAQTKAAANYIAGHHNDDSVMKTIIQMLSLQS